MTRQTSYEAARDLVTRLAYAHPGATDALAQVSYAYDALGRPTERRSFYGSTPELTHAYTYNSRSELTGETLRNGETDTSASASAYAYAYAYDNIGNRTRAEEGSASAPTAYTANALNQYTGIQEGGTAAAFAPTYNADGGMTKLCTATGIWNVTWNAENRPIKWVNPSAKTTIECAYDFMGRRCMKKVTQNGTVASHRLYLYRGYLLIAELDALNTVSTNTPTDEGAATAPVVRKTWLWDPSEPTATRPLAMTNFDAAGRPVETLYYAHDLLKNTIALFDGEGNERAQYDYAAFGQTLARSGPAAETNPYRYSGEYADDELGLIYYNYRHYDPQTGRWISRDPIGENGGVNLYGFVGNEVAEMNDNLGLQGLGGPGCHLNSPSCGFTGENLDQEQKALVVGAGIYATVMLLRGIGAYIAYRIRRIRPEKSAKRTRKKRDKNRQRCKPCIPPAGSLRHEIARPSTRVRGAHKCDSVGHVRIWTMNQAPYPSCKCFWNGPITWENTQTPPEGSSPDGPPPPNPARGGGRLDE